MRAMIILAVFCLCGAGLSLKLHCDAEEGILLSMLAMIAAAYAAALMGILSLVRFLPWVAGLASVAYLIMTFVRGRRKALGDLLGGALLFLAAGIALWWLCCGCALSVWDDFSHWGYALKVMFHTNGLYTAPGYGHGFASYPPASTLWQYLVLCASGAGWREDIALWAHALLSASMLLTAVKAMVRRRIAAKAVGYVMLWVILFQLYPHASTMLAVDVLLGMTTAAVLLAEFLPGRSRATPWLEILGCFALCLMKSSGFSLALLTVAVVFVRRLYLFWRRKRAKDVRLLPLVTPAVMLAAVLAARLSWAAHLTLLQVAERWHSDEPLVPAVWAFITFRGPAYRFEVFRLFFKELFTAISYGGAIRFPWIGWIVMGLILGVIALVLSKQDERGPICAGLGAALAVAAVFTLSLLFSYLFLFNASEAMGLASITRYLNTACIVMVASGAAFALTALSHRELPVRAAALLCVALLMFLSGPAEVLTDTFVQAPTHAEKTNQEAYPARRAALRIRSLGEEPPRLYLITANDHGLAQLRVAYELLPWTLPPHGTMLMTENSESMPGAIQCTWQEWRQVLLDGYEYVYVYSPEPQFVQEFAPVFEDGSHIAADRMFRVVPSDKDAILHNIPEITANPLPDC